MEFYDPLGSVIHLLLHIIIILARFFKIQQQVDDLINVPKYSKRLNFSVFPEKPLFFLAGNRTVCLVRLKTTISKDLPVPWGVELELHVQVLKPSSRSYAEVIILIHNDGSTLTIIGCFWYWSTLL